MTQEAQSGTATISPRARLGGIANRLNPQHWGTLVRKAYGRLSGSSASSVQPLEASLNAAERLLGETSDGQAVKIAGELAQTLRSLNDADLLSFFLELADRFGPDHAALQTAAKSYLGSPTAEEAAKLGQVAEPRRVDLVRRLNMAPDATMLIIQLREKLLKLSRSQPRLAPIANEIQQLLSSWFNRGFLRPEKLDWNTPASVLESIIRFESVHEIRDWNSLKSRLQGNRRCFGFFHPAIPGVPLIFIEVALTREMNGAITPVLAGAQEEALLSAPTHAIFYSINNCHTGLKGISLGDLLIKQVVVDLGAEFPSLKHFATLSPIPGFRRWLTAAQDKTPELIPAIVTDILANPEWHLDPVLVDQLSQPLSRLCAIYLSGLGLDGSQGRVTDPVARFHMSNGARLERINWFADPSAKGIKESYGLMVNYHYDLRSIDANHRAFVHEEKVSIAPAVKQLSEDAKSKQRGAK